MGSSLVKAAPTRSSCVGPWPAWRALSPAIEAGVYSSTAVWGGSCQRALTPSATGQSLCTLTACWVGRPAHLPAKWPSPVPSRPTRPRTDDLCRMLGAGAGHSPRSGHRQFRCTQCTQLPSPTCDE
eukprot:scaffold25834_cov68-Phaeocystis_antarctica.AAC.1